MSDFGTQFRKAPFWLGLLGNPGLILLIVGIAGRTLDQLEVIVKFAILSMALNVIGLVAAIIICDKAKPPTDADKVGLVVNSITAVMWLALWVLALYLGPKGTVVL